MKNVLMYLLLSLLFIGLFVLISMTYWLLINYFALSIGLAVTFILIKNKKIVKW